MQYKVPIQVSYRFDTNTLGLYKYPGIIESSSLNTTENVSFRISWVVCSVRASHNAYPSDALKVNRKPTTCLQLPAETPVGSSESVWKASRIAEKVRRTKELNMRGLNFCELNKKEKSALKAN